MQQSKHIGFLAVKPINKFIVASFLLGIGAFGYFLGKNSEAIAVVTPDPATSAISEANTAMAVVALKETVQEFNKSYDSFAKEANKLLSTLKPIEDEIESISGIQKDLQKRKDGLSRLVNKLHRAKDDPLSFRFPSLDPYTVGLIDSLESRFDKLYDASQSKKDSGMKRQYKRDAYLAAQVDLGKTGAIIQRKELETLKKVASRNAQDKEGQSSNDVLRKSSKLFELELSQQMLESMRNQEQLLLAIYNVVSGRALVEDIEVDKASVDEAIERVKKSQGTLIRDKKNVGGSRSER